MRVLLPVATFILTISNFFGGLKAQDYWQDSFAAANQFYYAADYQAAVNAYQNIINAGFESEELYYNLGNAHYKSGNKPLAVWAYEKTLLLNQDHQDAHYNLDLLRGQLQDQIRPNADYELRQFKTRLVNRFSPLNWTWLSVIAVWLACCGFAIFIFSGQSIIKKLGVLTGISCTAIFIVLTAMAWMGNNRVCHNKMAILLNEKATIWSAPGTDGQELQIIHEGLKLEMLETDSSWVKVALANGTQGWLQNPELKALAIR
ncbi:MAG: hypothetical protein KDC92_01415 [Bacteroidetes bacterium]|nr:hypothetical protein [Bacteroidota bacterium]